MRIAEELGVRIEMFTAEDGIHTFDNGLVVSTAVDVSILNVRIEISLFSLSPQRYDSG